jgi:general secretion pathway protein I
MRATGSAKRGFTLLEMIVATTIMGIAVAGLLSGISGATRNAARLRDYDRVVQLARLKMNDLLADPKVLLNVPLQGQFAPEITGGLEFGWRARVTVAEKSPQPSVGDFAIDRVQLEIWWTSGGKPQTFPLESYRRRSLRQQDLEAGGPQ